MDGERDKVGVVLGDNDSEGTSVDSHLKSVKRFGTYARTRA